MCASKTIWDGLLCLSECFTSADLLSRLASESSVVNHKMFPRDSSEDSLSACDRLQIYGIRQIIIDREGERRRDGGWIEAGSTFQ